MFTELEIPVFYIQMWSKGEYYNIFYAGKGFL